VADGNSTPKATWSKQTGRAKLKEVEDWVKMERRHLKKGELPRRAKARLVGHLNCYAITDKGRMSRFRARASRRAEFQSRLATDTGVIRC